MLPRPRHLSSPALPPVSKNGTRSHQRSLLWRLPGISAEFVWNKNDTAVDTFVLSIHGGPFRICFPTVETAYKSYICICVCVTGKSISSLLHLFTIPYILIDSLDIFLGSSHPHLNSVSLVMRCEELKRPMLGNTLAKSTAGP